MSRVISWNSARPRSVKLKVTFGWLFWSKFCSGSLMSSPVRDGLSLSTKYREGASSIGLPLESVCGWSSTTR